MKIFNFSKISRSGMILIVSGPSGAGKSTICRRVIEKNSNLNFSISCTTRQPRMNETDGIDYSFMDVSKFEKLISENAFLEYAEVHGNYYGTLKREVYERISYGQDILLDIDVQGALKIKNAALNDNILQKCAEYIFITPPDNKILEKRLRGRGTDSEEVIQKRLEKSLWEVNKNSEYEYLIVNDTIEKAVKDFEILYSAFKMKTCRMPHS
ncbi:MAG: guanylate kinase [Victivallales bacterium]|nr:guanylate kinase [Victivallales bacterium]MCF7888726.1 guanylate kinase [Victivallales bacterium]